MSNPFKYEEGSDLELAYLRGFERATQLAKEAVIAELYSYRQTIISEPERLNLTKYIEKLKGQI